MVWAMCHLGGPGRWGLVFAGVVSAALVGIRFHLLGFFQEPHLSKCGTAFPLVFWSALFLGGVGGSVAGGGGLLRMVLVVLYFIAALAVLFFFTVFH